MLEEWLMLKSPGQTLVRMDMTPQPWLPKDPAPCRGMPSAGELPGNSG